MKHTALFIFGVFMVLSCTAKTATPVIESSRSSTPEESQILFDDFSYYAVDELTSHGWIIREGSGWPGVTGATFRVENISFIDYPDPADNRLLRMTSST